MPDPVVAPSVAPDPVITFAKASDAKPDVTPVSKPAITPDTKPAAGGTGDQKPDATTPSDSEFEFQFEDGAEPVKVDFSKEDEARSPEAADKGKLKFSDLKAELKDKPELLKRLKEPLGKLDSYDKLFKDPVSAKAQMDRLNTLADGLERVDAAGKPVTGLDAIEAEYGEWSQALTAFRANDTQAIDAFITENPDIMKNLGQRYVAGWATTDPKSWGNYFAKVIMTQLKVQDTQGVSLLNRLNSLYKVKEIADNPEAAALLDGIAREVNGWDEASRAEVGAKQDVPKEIVEREKRVAAEEHKLWITKLDGKVSSVKNDYIARGLKTILKGKTVGKDALATYSKTALDEFNALVKADPEFQRNMKQYLDGRQDEKFLSSLRSAAQRFMPLALKAVYKKHNLGPQKAQVKQEASVKGEPGASSGSGSAPMVRYSGKFVQGGPDPGVIDYARMKQEFGNNGTSEHIANHQIYVKGQKALHYW